MHSLRRYERQTWSKSERRIPSRLSFLKETIMQLVQRHTWRLNTTHAGRTQDREIINTEMYRKENGEAGPALWECDSNVERLRKKETLQKHTRGVETAIKHKLALDIKMENSFHFFNPYKVKGFFKHAKDKTHSRRGVERVKKCWKSQPLPFGFTGAEVASRWMRVGNAGPLTRGLSPLHCSDVTKHMTQPLQ